MAAVTALNDLEIDPRVLEVAQGVGRHAFSLAQGRLLQPFGDSQEIHIYNRIVQHAIEVMDSQRTLGEIVAYASGVLDMASQLNISETSGVEPPISKSGNLFIQKAVGAYMEGLCKHLRVGNPLEVRITAATR